MPDIISRDLKISRSKSDSSKLKYNLKRKSITLEDPTTPRSLKFEHSDTSPHGFKRLFNRSRHASYDNSKSSPLVKSISSTPSSIKPNTIELPPIVSVRSKENTKQRHNSKHGFAFQDQSSASSYTNSKQGGDRHSLDYEVPKSEVNSILNVQPSDSQRSSDILRQNNSNVSSHSRLLSTSSHTTDINTTTGDDHEFDDSQEDSKAGLISSFLSAAANHINGIKNPEEVENNNTDQHSTASKPEVKSKIGHMFSSIKNFAADPNLPVEQFVRSLYGDHINSLANQGLQPRILLDGAPIETSLTKNVVFEPMKPSPLSTLGKGDLSLDDFEADSHLTRDRGRKSEDYTGTTTIDRIMSPVGRLASNMTDITRAASPPGLKNGIPRSASGRGLGDVSTLGENMGKRTFKSSKTKKLAWGIEDSDKNSTRTDTNDNDTVSPAISRVMTNGHSQTRGKFKLANEKRQLEFHLIFKQVPQSEKLIDDYSCALQKEILVQGRLFISESNVCFNSNIFGWVTNIVTPFSQVIQIEKKNTAGVFPNAIQVQTLHSKNIFASLLARESTFETMTAVWNQNLHGYNRDSLIWGDEIDDNADTEEEEDDMRSDESDVDSYTSGDEEDEAEPLDQDIDGSSPTDQSTKGSNDDGPKSSSNEEFNGIPFEGPRTHALTENGYEKKQGETLITDETIPAPVGVVYSLMFGDDSSFLKKYLEKSKNYDISDIPKLENVNGVKKREYSYVKPLSGPVGPKKTRCIINESVESCDFAKSVQVIQSSQSPDVPSGGSFTVKSTILLSWSSGNSTRLVVFTSVEWTAKSWIKGAVEKGSIDGQKESMGILISELKSRVAEQPVSRKRSTTTGRRRSKKQVKKVEPPKKVEEPQDDTSENAAIQIIKMVNAMIPIPEFLKLAIAIIFGIWIIWILLFAGHSKKPSKEFSTYSKVNIDGNDYILLPNSFSSGDYLSNKLEYDIWKWIDSRNGEHSNVGARTKSKRWNESNKAIEMDGHSRQSLEELMKLTQMKLDEMRRILDG